MFRFLEGVLAGPLVVAVLMGASNNGDAQELVRTIATGDYAPRSFGLAVSDDEQLVAWVSPDQSITVCGIDSGLEIARREFSRIEFGGLAPAICFMKENANQLAYLGKYNLILWNFKLGDTSEIDLSHPKLNSRHNAFALSPTASRIATLTGTRGEKTMIQVRSVHDEASAELLTIRGWPLQLVFPEDSQLTVAVRRYLRRSKSFVAFVERWNVESGEREHQWGPFPMTGTRLNGGSFRQLGSVGLSADGRFLATTIGERILILDVVTSRQLNAVRHYAAAPAGAMPRLPESSTPEEHSSVRSNSIRMLMYWPPEHGAPPSFNSGPSQTGAPPKNSDSRRWSLFGDFDTHGPASC